MKQRHKELIIAFFTFIGGLYFFLEFLLPNVIEFIWPEASLAEFLKQILPSSMTPADIDTANSYKAEKVHDAISKGVQVVGVMAIGLGIINILRVHGENILKSRKGWFNSAALIIGLFCIFTFETIDLINAEEKNLERSRIDNLIEFVEVIGRDYEEKQTEPVMRIEALEGVLNDYEKRSTGGAGYLNINVEKESARPSATFFAGALTEATSSASALKELYRKDVSGDDQKSALEKSSAALSSSLKALAEATQKLSTANYEETTAKEANEFFFKGFFTPLGSAMFSLLAFYIASAAYRSFRIRSVEALVMMIPAIIVMLGQIPHGPLYISEDLPAIRAWLLDNISTPAFRAITFGSLVASLAMAVRMWLSLEQSPLSSDADGGSDE